MGPLKELLQVVALYPDRPALETPEGQVFTYKKFLEAIYREVDALAVLGVKPRSRVLLIETPSYSWAISVWAIWFSGATVVPVDERTPEARLQTIIDSVQPDLIWPCPVPMVAMSCAHKNSCVHKNQEAWLIHSSGSTGTPKGISVSFNGVDNLLQAQREAFASHTEARWMALLSPAFDASLSDLLVAHTSGACLVCTDLPLLQQPKLLVEEFTRRGITHADLPPSVVSRIPAEDIPESLETVVMGGEVCSPQAARDWSKKVNLVSVYGPTEATICTSMVQVTPDWDLPDIGHPFPGVQYRIVNDELQIAGPCLALGYTDTELTKKRFVDGWFLTGDRVCLVDGRYVYKGRMDRMVKLQGRLTHPEELEKVLMDHPSVTRASAWVSGDRLSCAVVGYVQVPVLRSWVQDHLPEWMQPAQIHPVDQLPETDSGKVALGSVQKLVPQTLLESVWSKALGRTVKATDDLDALGRDSFAVLEVLSQSTRLGLNLSPEAVSSAKTCTDMMTEEDQALTVQQIRDRVGPLPERADVPVYMKQKILVTGGNGNLGSALVPYLLKTGADVWILSRSGGPPDQDVIHVQGDITKPSFGLSDEEYMKLAGEVNTVVHLAANLNALASLDQLWAVNVEGTRNVLTFATLGLPKVVHHASTLAIFACSDMEPGALSVLDSLNPDSKVQGGYPQSKLAAEMLAEAYGAHIARFGLLVGEELDHILKNFVRGAKGKVFETPEIECNYTDMGEAAELYGWYIQAGTTGVDHIVSASNFTLGEVLCELEGYSPVDVELQDAIWSERVQAAPYDRHPSNLFLSTGWSWGGNVAGSESVDVKNLVQRAMGKYP